jgi:hypothetical protein
MWMMPGMSMVRPGKATKVTLQKEMGKTIACRAERAAAFVLVEARAEDSALAADEAAERDATLALAVWAIEASCRLAAAAWAAEEAVAAAWTAAEASNAVLFEVSISDIDWSLPAPWVRVATCELTCETAAA